MYTLTIASTRYYPVRGLPFRALVRHLPDPGPLREPGVVANLVFVGIAPVAPVGESRAEIVLPGEVVKALLEKEGIDGYSLPRLQVYYEPSAHVRYAPDYLVYAPPDAPMLNDYSWYPPPREKGYLLAAYNAEHNILAVPNMFMGRIAEIAATIGELVELLRRHGVPIPRKPVPRGRGVVSFPEAKITLGADPEFELVLRGRIVSAHRVLSRVVPLPWGEIGLDGAGDQVEIRPDPGDPKELVLNAGRLILAIPKIVGGYPSTMSEYYPVGGHVHIGFSEPDDVIPYASQIVEAIDGEMGGFFQELSSKLRLERGYGYRGDWREQPWGIEYRTPPACIWAHPEAALAFLQAIAHITRRMLAGGHWNPSRDRFWKANLLPKVRRAVMLLKKYEGRLHWAAWKKWVGDVDITANVHVQLSDGAEVDDEFLNDLKLMLVRLGLPTIRVIPLRRSRGDYASNVEGYGAMEEGFTPFYPDLVLALSWRFRNDPAFRREELPKLEEAIARILNSDGQDDGDAGRLIKEEIHLEGDWPDVPPPKPIRLDREDDEAECASCHELYPIENTICNERGDRLCPDCYHDIYAVCTACSREVRRDEAYFVDDYRTAYCQDCFFERYDHCEWCGELTPRDDLDVVFVQEGNRTDQALVCRYCAETALRWDDEIGAYVPVRRR